MKAALLAAQVRWLAAVIAGGQALFALSWLVAGAVTDGYSHERQHVSELAARSAEHAWIVTLGIAALGVSWIALAYVLSRALPRGRWWRRGAMLFAIAGVATILVALAPLDCAPSVDEACRARGEAWDLSWQHYAHVALAWIAQLALALTPFALALALRGTPLAGPLALLGCLGLLFGAATTTISFVDEDRGGIYQRAGLVVLHGWTCLLAGALYALAVMRSSGARQPHVG
jgi:hypothetical protein